MILGIDASNIRSGGGVTYLVELLRAANPSAHGFAKVVVWAPQATLANIDDQHWLEKRSHPVLEGHYLRRALWQRRALGSLLLSENCDILFVPGGSFATNFRPVVTASLNLMPFEWRELLRYRVSTATLKFVLVRWAQSQSFKKAEGVIFLTKYAKDVILLLNSILVRENITIPFGINQRWFLHPRPSRPISECSVANPFRLIYLSIIDQYKHQWHLVEAVAQLRQKTGWQLALDLVGSAYPPALKRLKASLQRFDPGGCWARYHGPVPDAELHEMYTQADLGVFASSCENMPNILLETMAAGLPIACSNRGPMPEILQDAGLYFNPEQPGDIVSVLKQLIESPDLRARLVQASYTAAQAFTWERCAGETFAFLALSCRRYQTKALQELVKPC